MDYELQFLKSLALTISIETVVLLLIDHFFFKAFKTNRWLLLVTGITASLSTLPYLWFIFPIFLKTKILYIVVSEATAVMAESVIILGFLRIGYKQAFLISLACNAVSYSIGLLL